MLDMGTAHYNSKGQYDTGSVTYSLGVTWPAYQGLEVIRSTQITIYTSPDVLDFEDEVDVFKAYKTEQFIFKVHTALSESVFLREPAVNWYQETDSTEGGQKQRNDLRKGHYHLF